jgi:hypothetical protein
MRYALSLSLLATAVLGVSACGSSGSNPSDGGSTAAQGPDSAKASHALAFAHCMRSHGVPNFPDPTSSGQVQLQIARSPNSTSVNGVEVNGPAFQSAMQACRAYLPNGGHPSAAKTAQVRAQALAMSRCMRSHGVPNFPDPQFSNGGAGFGIRLNGSGLDPNSPAFQAAQKTCGSILGNAPLTAKAPG